MIITHSGDIGVGYRGGDVGYKVDVYRAIGEQWRYTGCKFSGRFYNFKINEMSRVERVYVVVS